VVGHQLRAYPATSAPGGVAGQGQGSMSFSRRVLHMDPCPWPALSQVCRRDGIPAFAASYPVAGRHTVRPVILIRAPCVPVLTGITGSGGQKLTDCA
jgi:hypothetical protein